MAQATNRYTVTLTPRAIRDLEGIRDAVAQRRIATAIDGLEQNPRPSGVKILKDTSVTAYRIRVGSYRILYTINDKVMTVTVARLGHRKAVYRR